jgi:Acyl-CoA dehydrogenase, N-terminal domain
VISGYWERAEMPWSLIRRIGELGIVGEDIEGYGCPGLDPIACGLVHMELNRGDGSLGTFLGVHTGLAIKSIAMLGSEEQKQDWLPGMARLEKLGAFALTEPNHRSDSVALETTVRRDSDQFVINGAKRLGVEPGWVGGARFHEGPVDIAVLAARPDDDVGQAAVSDPDIRVFPRVLGMPGGAPLAGPAAATDRSVDQQAEGGRHRSLISNAKRLTKLGRLRVAVSFIALTGGSPWPCWTISASMARWPSSPARRPVWGSRSPWHWRRPVPTSRSVHAGSTA